MTKFREHRGSLAEAMATVVEVNSLAELEDYLRPLLWPFYISVPSGALSIQPYGYDDRIGWDTYIVTLPRCGVLGFTDGPLES